MPFYQVAARAGYFGSIVVLLGSLGVLSGCDKLDLRSDSDYLERARTFEAKGDYTSAILEAKNALQKNSQNLDARLLLGNAYVKVGNGVEGEIALKQALDAGADVNTTSVGIARAIYLQGDMKRVLADVTVPSSATPALAAKILVIRGEAQLEMGRYSDAQKSFDQAIVSEPRMAEALTGQARIALAGRQYDKATALVQQVLERAPADLPALIVKGDIERTRGHYDEAAATYKKAVEIDPHNLIALVNITSMELGSNRFDDASKHIAQIRQFNGAEVMSLYLQAFLDFRKQNFAAARDPIQKVLAASPEHLPTIVLAGANEFALNSYEQAQKYLTQALAISPNLVLAKRVLIATYTRTGQIPQALDLLKSAVAQTPDDPGLMTLAGETYMKAGDYANATRYLSRAVALNPQSSDTRTQLGLSRLAAGDNQAALADLEKAVEADPKAYNAEKMLIVAYMNLKDYPHAGQAINNLEKKQPDSPIASNFKGGLLLATNDMPGARAAFERSLSLDPTYVPAAINLAKLDLADKKFDAAKRRFTDILAKNPRSIDASLALVEVQQKAGAPTADIVGTLNKAIDANPGAIKPLVILSRQLVNTDPANSLVAAKKAAAVSPNDPEVLDALGSAQLASGEERAAQTSFTKLVDVSPRSASGMFRLASLLDRNANPAAAARLLRRAIEIQPDYLEAQVALVSLELNAGNTNEALKIARRVQTDKPQSPFGFLLEGDAQMASKAYARAATSYEKAYALSKSGALAIKVYTAYSAGGQESAAVARLQDWLAQQPDDGAVRYFLAGAAAGKGDYRLAISQYETLLKKEPDNPIILNDLAVAYDQVLDPRALATAESAHKLKPDEAPINDTLGWMLVQRGERARGVSLLRDAARTAPQAVDIRMHLVRGLLDSGDKNGARVELEALVNRRENFPQRSAAEKLLATLQVDS